MFLLLSECSGYVIGNKCQPMMGYVTAYVEHARVPSPSDKEMVASTLLETLNLGMKQNIYSMGAVQKVVYVGTRQIVSGVHESANTGNETIGKSPLEIALVCGGSVLLLLLLIPVIVVSSRRRRKSSQSTRIILEPSVEDSDCENTVFSDEPTHSRRKYRLKPSKAKPAQLQLNSQQSLEGAEMSGSLAAMDALALKAQRRICSNDASSIPQSTPPSRRKEGPSTPQTIPDTSWNNSSASLDHHVLSKANLSCVQNHRTGAPPSTVSPKRNNSR